MFLKEYSKFLNDETCDFLKLLSIAWGGFFYIIEVNENGKYKHSNNYKHKNPTKILSGRYCYV